MRLEDRQAEMKARRTRKARSASVLMAEEPRVDTPWTQYQKDWARDESRLTFAVKAAQIGYSSATASWAIGRCIDRSKHLIIMLSRSEAQAKELVLKAKRQVDELGSVDAAVGSESVTLSNAVKMEHSIRFPNGSRIVALSSDPDTARGYTGDVVLDEFAFHPESQAIFKAAYRQITLGHKMRVLSTPNGEAGKFYEIAKAVGLDAGVRPKTLPYAARGWSCHWCDVFRAVECGFGIDIDELRAGCDGNLFAQEYCCRFLSNDLMWITPDKYQACVDKVASVGTPNGFALYGGYDVARNKDLAVLWALEQYGDGFMTVGVMEMRNTPTPDQREILRSLMRCFARLAIDKTGMGLTIFEDLDREFPGRIDGVNFTGPIKEIMATQGKKAVEERKAKLPDDPACRHAFTSVRRSTNAVGSARYDAQHDEHGHADHWWAFCLALMAAQGSGYGYAARDDVPHAMPVAKPIFAGFRNTVL